MYKKVLRFIYINNNIDHRRFKFYQKVNNKLFFNLLFIISDEIWIFHDRYYCLHKWNVKHNLQILHVISYVKIIYIRWSKKFWAFFRFIYFYFINTLKSDICTDIFIILLLHYFFLCSVFQCIIICILYILS